MLLRTKMHTLFLRAENNMYEFGGSDLFILLVVVAVFILGIYTLVKFRKNKNF
jgi:hypothetical protein